jgi:hypothetical protein
LPLSIKSLLAVSETVIPIIPVIPVIPLTYLFHHQPAIKIADINGKTAKLTDITGINDSTQESLSSGNSIEVSTPP